MSGEGIEAPREASVSPVSKKPTRWRVTVLAVVLLLLVLGEGTYFVLSHPAAIAPLQDTAPVEAEIEVRARELQALTWDRPVLRGAPLDGDGTRALDAAVVALDRRRRKLGFVRKDIEARIPVDPSAELPLLGEELDAVRLALQHESLAAWAKRAGHERGAGDSLLLAAAENTESPGECLELLADRIRFDQDELVGRGTVGPALRMTPVMPIALECAGRASDVELAAASWEMHVLATHGTPIARELRARAIGAADWALPGSGEDTGLLDRLRDGGDHEQAIAEAWTWLGHDATFRDADELRFPEIEPIAVAVFPRLSMRRPHDDHFGAHAEAEARIKQLALAFSWLEGAWKPPALPGDEVSKDPFSGERLIAEPAEGGGIRLVSVGSDGRRDPKPQGDDLVLEVPPRAPRSGSGAEARHGAP